jgi:hypothetical protein
VVTIADSQVGLPSARRVNFGMHDLSQHLAKMLGSGGDAAAALSDSALTLLRNSVLRVAASAGEAKEVLAKVYHPPPLLPSSYPHPPPPAQTTRFLFPSPLFTPLPYIAPTLPQTPNASCTPPFTAAPRPHHSHEYYHNLDLPPPLSLTIGH